ncbi:uncharacterized protein N7498_009166 [Penicillium cinerascens]|uniref:Uncharacterized protein n=1 Tax=Penicillium cinerascens TaxID=70096 RepID=A0A9W9M584_9EURO|nr:uncharacterized protein N7498_009166 [Penicillium cinerascens]KAJ5190181.1 hypothetical protein N7498_009166 [Penicillium cinerascens]
MCMQMWDTLRAMLVYGVLDLQAYPSRRKGDWKQSSYCKDLKDPFLVQMSRALSARIGETPHEDLLSASTHALQQLEHWTVAETARRTIFLSNIVHFLSSHDPQNRKPSPYCEPLDLRLIRNMPFPCAVTPCLVHERNESGW